MKMKRQNSVLFRCSAIAVVVLATALLLQSGCGKGGGSKGAGTGTTTPTGTGTGTGTSTGTGDPGNAVPMDMTWVVQVDAPTSWLEARANQIKTEFAGGLWKATEGQMYLNNEVLRNNTSEGNVVFMNLDQDKLASGALGMCRGYGDVWWIELPGICTANHFLHEFCHGEFVRRVEEYDCGVCSMGAYDGKWIAHYCNDQDCMNPGIPSGLCWTNFILKKYTDWTQTGHDPGGHPACTVEIQ